MKKRFVITLMFFLFASFVVVSACTGGNNQIIMKLSGSTNAHVSDWSSTTYTNEICYDDIFGVTYDGPNPHDCLNIGSNTILNVYSTDNSHASTTSDAIYTEKICHSNLQCFYTEDTACADGTYETARMYRYYNSHLADIGDPNYNVKICCANMYWADLDGEMISEANKGQTVLLFAPLGLSGNFEIKEDDFFIDDFIDDKIQDVALSTRFTGYIAQWTITAEDLEKTRDLDQFYFEVGGQKSNYLKIDQKIVDDEMTVSITEPACGSYFEVGQPLSIEIEARDGDDFINGSLMIEGEKVGRDFANEIYTYDHTFTESGEYQVVIEANNTRGKRARSISNIMVWDSSVDANYTAACIKSPKDFGDFEEIDVEFDASTTRGLKVEGGIPTPLVPGVTPFNWKWIFDFGIGRKEEVPCNEITNGSNENCYKFYMNFVTSGQKSANLEVSL